MKKVTGILAILFGSMFLVDPEFDIYYFFENFSYLMIRYWPVFLIGFGVYLQTSHKVKKKR